MVLQNKSNSTTYLANAVINIYQNKMLRLLRLVTYSRTILIPFNPATTIRYQLPKAGFVTLKIFDMIGKEVAVLADGFKQEGQYSVDFNAGSLASGLYFYELRVNDFSATKKMMLIK